MEAGFRRYRPPEMSSPSKLDELKAIVRDYRSAIVAFSGGVDSTLVLRVAREVLGPERAKAVTAASESVPKRELELAKQVARSLDVEHRVIETRELENPHYRSNSTQRCYFCKTTLYDQLIRVAREWRLDTICNGTNTDDLGDFRPGLRAADEHGIKSPLVEAGIGKEEVRRLSRTLGLSVWDKPASPCLSSRIPYGREVTQEKLSQVERGEDFLKDLGFKVVRLRHFGLKAHLELGHEELIRVTEVGLRNQITEFILSLGFTTVRVEPYQSGRLNHPAAQE